MTETIESLKLSSQLCFPLYACSKELVRQYRVPLEALGLTYTQYVVMLALWEHGGMTEKVLGEIVHLDSGTLAPLLKRLENQGYVLRERERSRDRTGFISLTEAGGSLREKAASVPQTMTNCIGLSTEECVTLRELLDKALNAMESKNEIMKDE